MIMFKVPIVTHRTARPLNNDPIRVIFVIIHLNAKSP